MGLDVSRSRVYSIQEAWNTANAGLPVRHGGLGAACYQMFSLHGSQRGWWVCWRSLHELW